MKIFPKVFLAFFLFVVVSCASLEAVLAGMQTDLTNEEAVSAFKAAMNLGVSFASDALSKKDAYFKDQALKILLPDEASLILDNLAKIPFGQSLLDDVILRINRSAELVAKELVAIFTKTIREMTVIDGLHIVFGEKDACTKYVYDKTYEDLVALYLPKMQACLDKPLLFGVSATTAWKNLLDAYNLAAKPANATARLFGQKEAMPPINANLTVFTTEKALEGVFARISEEETKIRTMPEKYDVAIVRKVFSEVKKRSSFY